MLKTDECSEIGATYSDFVESKEASRCKGVGQDGATFSSPCLLQLQAAPSEAESRFQRKIAELMTMSLLFCGGSSAGCRGLERTESLSYRNSHSEQVVD